MADITLMVVTDGRRECLEQTLATFYWHIDPTHIGRRVVVNDCPDPAYEKWLDTLGFDHHVRPLGQRRGFAGAIAAGWNAIGDTDFVFHLEDDFLMNRDIDLAALAGVLDRNPHLAQMALRRQPWNETEAAAGGVVEVMPDAYQDCTDGTHHWLEHRVFFTTNPSLYRRSLVDRGWPLVEHSEGIFSHHLFADPDLRSGYWGRRTDKPWVHHIGVMRAGVGF